MSARWIWDDRDFKIRDATAVRRDRKWIFKEVTYCACSRRRPDGITSRWWVRQFWRSELNVSIFLPMLQLNDDIFAYTWKISNLGSLDVISGDILDRRGERILRFLPGVRSLWNSNAFKQGLQVVTSYNYKYWMQESSVYFPRLLYRCISRFIAFICR